MIRIDSLARSVRYRLSLLLGAVAIVVLLVSTVARALGWSDIYLALAFGAVIALANVWCVPAAGGVVSLMPMMAASALLVLGPVPAGWAVVLGSLGHAAVRYWRGQRNPELQEPRGTALVEVTALNMAMHTLGILAGAGVHLGGRCSALILCLSPRCGAVGPGWHHVSWHQLPSGLGVLCYSRLRRSEGVPALAAQDPPL